MRIAFFNRSADVLLLVEFPKTLAVAVVRDDRQVLKVTDAITLHTLFSQPAHFLLHHSRQDRVVLVRNKAKFKISLQF